MMMFHAIACIMLTLGEKFHLINKHKSFKYLIVQVKINGKASRQLLIFAIKKVFRKN
jgi:hypothetical protein